MKIVAEYIWRDSLCSLRSKTKILNWVETQSAFNIETYPIWNYDGSSTGQATTENSEVLLKPVKIYKNPLRNNSNNLVNTIVLCETYINDNGLKPHENNTRNSAFNTFQDNLDKNPMFGLELEFFLFRNGKPLAMPKYPNEYPSPQGDYYCGVGSKNIYLRNMIEDVLKAALEMGLGITGLNAEVAPGQWEFQVCNTGIDACDHFVIFKYILEMIGEKYNVEINYHPKPIEGDWNGSGCHVNFSTKEMRAEGGYKLILESINKLKLKHNEHMLVYGHDNDKRLTGKHETANFNTFSYGVADRGCSIRIPKSTHENQCGYFEDRRPSSNIDPYVVCEKIFTTSCL
jgi:glutamine synthetase